MRVRKGDRVMVIAGKDRGRESTVMRAIPKDNKVIVEGVNTVKKHQKATRTTMQGGVIDRDMPIHVSNVMLICPTDGPVRSGAGWDDEGKKIRTCKVCGVEI